MYKNILFLNIVLACFCHSALSQENIAIVDVNVIPMTSEVVLKNQTILISDGIIDAIGNSNEVKIPNGYKIIDTSAKFILPGFINMYTHVNESNLILYLANGQTTVRDIPSHMNVLGLREQVKNKEILGPRIVSYGLRATGAPAPYHSQQPIFTAEQGKEQVHEAKRLGYDGMYIYATCLPETYDAILDEAEKIKLPISGHFPIFINEDRVLQSKQPEFTNLTGLTRGGKLIVDRNKLINKLKEYNKAITPSLAVHRNWSFSHRKDSLYNSSNMGFIPPKLRVNWRPNFDENIEKSTYPYEEVAGFVKELSDNNIQLFLGSDGGYPLVVPGFAYLDEMELFVKAGISNYKTLRYATVDAAKYLNLEDVGTIEIGKKAELILYNSNPLDDIETIRSVKGVILGNAWLDENFLNVQLSKLTQSNGSRSNRFYNWEKYLTAEEKTEELKYTFFTDDSEVGEQRLLIDSLENKTVLIRSVMIADAPDYRETYSYHRVKNGKIDSLSIINKGSEGITNATLFRKIDSVYISGFSPFHGNFSFVKFAPPNTQLWAPFISRYFELDNLVNYHLAQVLNHKLDTNEANLFNVIQIELNSEEYGEKYIVDESTVTLFKTHEEQFQIIYPGFSGFSNRTSLPFNVHITVDNKNRINEISYSNHTIVRNN